MSGCANTATQQLSDRATQRLADMGSVLATLPSKCTIGDAADRPGVWINAANATPAPDIPASMIFTFNGAIRTDAFRAALNPGALENLDKVESRDAQGNWSIRWTGKRPAAPSDCPAVKLAELFANGQHEVTALRITLRPVIGVSMNVADVSVLK